MVKNVLKDEDASKIFKDEMEVEREIREEEEAERTTQFEQIKASEQVQKRVDEMKSRRAFKKGDKNRRKNGEK